MSKQRPVIDLASLTAEAAAPMAEAAQRIPAKQPPAPTAEPPRAASPVPLKAVSQQKAEEAEERKTANLQGLAFKVPASFRRRFRQRAADADLKLNELLFEALEAWEEKNHLKSRNS